MNKFTRVKTLSPISNHAMNSRRMFVDDCTPSEPSCGGKPKDSEKKFCLPPKKRIYAKQCPPRLVECKKVECKKKCVNEEKARNPDPLPCHPITGQPFVPYVRCPDGCVSTPCDPCTPGIPRCTPPSDKYKTRANEACIKTKWDCNTNDQNK